MDLVDDQELLRRFSDAGSQDAFAEVVRRHIDRVYTVALRQLCGDTHLAEDVTQRVFIDLAAKSRTIASRPVIGGWLYQSTLFAASSTVRGEQRRRKREEAAAFMHEANEGGGSDPGRLRPLLDEAASDLTEEDRDAVWLRFFDQKSYAEIGHQLRLNENTARMRVERSLEKLRQALARRGVSSTGAALGTALSCQPIVAAPAGLSGAILITAAGSASAGAVSGAAGFLAFMSSFKANLGILALLLAVSVGTNAYLYYASPAPAAQASVSTLGEPRASIRPAAANGTQIGFPGANADLAAMRDALRVAGASDASIRATLEGILRSQYRDKLAADRKARYERGWWKDGQRTKGTLSDMQRLGDDPVLLQKMVSLPLEALLGVDPRDAAESDARYGFLPANLREALGRLDRRRLSTYATTGNPAADREAKSEYDATNLEVDEERAVLLTRLTPEQRTEYDLRFGSFSSALARQLAPLEVSEKEFRDVHPLAESYNKAAAGLANRTGDEASHLAVEMAQNLISTIGHDRALGFIWGTAQEYPLYARVAREASLPPDAAGRALQLAAETADRAVGIHSDPTLTLEAKRAALAELQMQARPAFDAIFPPAAQAKLTPSALAWFTGLAEGRYKIIGTFLPGMVGMAISFPPVALESAVPQAAGNYQRLSRAAAASASNK